MLMELILTCIRETMHLFQLDQPIPVENIENIKLSSGKLVNIYPYCIAPESVVGMKIQYMQCLVVTCGEDIWLQVV